MPQIKYTANDQLTERYWAMVYKALDTIIGPWEAAKAAAALPPDDPNYKAFEAPKLTDNDINQLGIASTGAFNLAAGLDEARKALAYYADPKNYQVSQRTLVQEDGGDVARLAQARIDPT